MSGRLVGEVIAASDSLRARDLPPRAFRALLAIAEKAGAHDREASVRWDHIRAGLYGASKRTAERAVDDLVAAGLVSVVRKGFKNQHSAQAPVYRILSLEDHDTQVSESRPEDHDTQVSVSRPEDHDKPRVGYRQNGVGSRHPGVVLDGSLDGSSDGAARVDNEPRCRLHADPHRYPIPPSCRDCRWIREQLQQVQHRESDDESRRRAEAAERRRSCAECGGTGFVDVADDEVAHCPACRPAPAVAL